jgi:hypothetical protein
MFMELMMCSMNKLCTDMNSLQQHKPNDIIITENYEFLSGGKCSQSDHLWHFWTILSHLQ